MWITALMFFQLWMLLGYLYAHGLGLLGDRRLQMGIHAVLLLLALAALPLTLPEPSTPTLPHSLQSAPPCWR